MDKIKYIGKAYKDYFKSFSSKIIRIDEKDLKGFASYLKIFEVNRPLFVGDKGNEICLADDKYWEMQYLPDNKFWRLSAMYDDQDKIIEWYFDINKVNSIDENGNPFCIDLYLDVVLMPDGKILILDEDELLIALNNRIISKEDYNFAYNVKDELLNSNIVNVKYMELFCEKLLKIFAKEEEKNAESGQNIV